MRSAKHSCRMNEISEKRRRLTLNDAEPKQVTVLQPEEIANLDQQFLAKSLHLTREIQEVLSFSQKTQKLSRAATNNYFTINYSGD